MKRLLLETLRDSVSARFWRYFGIGGGVGSLIAILLAAKNFGNVSAEGSLLIGVLFLLSWGVLLFIFFLTKNIYRHWIYQLRDSVYGDIILHLQDAFSRVNWLRKTEEISDEQFKSTMIYVCDRLKIIYDKLTKADCSVSIKVALDAEELTLETQMHNICRDHKSNWRDNDDYKKIPHYIFSNSCYRDILTNLTANKKSRLFYVNHDIPNTDGYDNTSKESYKGGILPYKSELVVPIIPIINDDSTSIPCVGFLCIDCESTGKFKGTYDIPMLQGVADNIYDMIKLRKP